MYDEPKSPNEGRGCLTQVMNRYRQMRGMFSMYEKPESLNGGCA